MTALSRAEQQVASAREQVWLRPCDQTIDRLITAVRAHAAEVVRADTGHIRYGSATDYAERHANLINPKEQQ